MAGNKEVALTLAVQTLEKLPGRNEQHGNWVIELARKYEAYLNEGVKEDQFSVVLQSYGNSALNTIRRVKDITGMDFITSRDFITQLPGVIKNGVSRDEAIMIQNQFKWTGAVVSVEKCSSK